MTHQQSTVGLTLKIGVDNTGAIRAVQTLGSELKKVQESAFGRGGAGIAVGPGAVGGGGAAGGAAGGGGGVPSNPFHHGATSRVSAFDRPIPVIVVGPKSLTDGMGGKGPGGTKNPDPTPPGGNDRTLAILRNLGLGGIAGRMGQMQGYADVAADLGFKKLGAGIDKAALSAAVVAAVASAGMHVTGRGMEIGTDPFGTPEGMRRRAFREFVPGGSKLQGWWDSVGPALEDSFRSTFQRGYRGKPGGQLASRENQITKAHYDAQVWELEGQGIMSHIGEMGPMRVQNAGLREMARQYNAYSVPLAHGNLSTAAGEVEFRQQSRLLPLYREKLSLEREAARATAMRAQQEKEIESIDAFRGAYGMSSNRGQGAKERALRGEGDGSGPGFIRSMLGLAVSEGMSASLLGARSKAEQELNRLKEQEVRAKGAVKGKEFDIEAAKAGNLWEKAGMAGSAAQRLGGMGPMQRLWGRQAYELLERTGNPDMLPPELIAAAQGYAPNATAKLLEKAGSQTDEYKHLGRIEGFGGDQSPEQMRQGAIGLENRAATGRMEVDAKIAAALDKNAVEMAVVVADAIEKRIQRFKNELEARMMAGQR